MFLRNTFPSIRIASAGPADADRSRIHLAKVFEKVPAVMPEIPVFAVKTKQLGQLSAGKKKCHAALEAHHHALGDEIHNRARFDQPGDKRNQRHQQSRPCCQRTEPTCIAAGDISQRGSNQQRDGRCDGNDGMT